MQIKKILLASLMAASAKAHYANMALDGVSCYIYNGIKGTQEGDMIVRLANGTWYDHDDKSNNGSITVVRSQADYDALPVKTKVGIVCAPDDIETVGLGVPYIEMEPSDEDFYREDNTIYKETKREEGLFAKLVKRFTFKCMIVFCTGEH